MGTTPPEPKPARPFTVIAGGRRFAIAPDGAFPQACNRHGDNEWFVNVDCTEVGDRNRTAQAIVEGAVSVTREALAASDEIRQAIESAAYSFSGLPLADGFTVEIAR